MSKINDNQIQDRLKTISQIKPGTESTDRAIQKTRQSLINKENSQQYTGKTILLNIFKNPVIKFAAAAVLMIGLGYIGGRLSARQTVNIEELRTVIRNDLVKEMNEQWQSAFTANCAQLKDELHQQVRRDLTEFAVQTLAATNQNLMELTRLIEAARRMDSERTERAFQQIGLNQTKLEKGLLVLATRTNETPDIKEN